jgi:GT2 family glycosyltransferase
MCMLSIVIVHYETPRLLQQCLTSIFAASTEQSFEVVVIDNASKDTELQQVIPKFRGVTFQLNKVNVGFAAACNQAIRMCRGRYVWILNPDTVVTPNEFPQLVSFMAAHPLVGACGPRLVYPNGELQLSCRKFPTLFTLALRIFRLNRFISRSVRLYLMADWDHASIKEVDWVIGGCMLLRREAIEEIDLFDEGFFMYYEDIDLCYRLKQKGWKVYYHSEVSVVHHHRRTSANLLSNRQSYFHAKSLWHLFSKHGLSWH